MYDISHVRHLLALVLFSSFVHAAGIKGTVKDPSGAAVAGTNVEVRAVPATSSPKTTKTDATGAFQFTSLSGTQFRLRVARPGFDPFETDVTVEEGKDAFVEINLKVAESRESIDVAGGKRQSVDAIYRALRVGDAAESFTVENLVL